MRESLPKFRYHPDPLSTGAIEASDTVCCCCGKSRGFVYVGPIFSEDELDNSICPWCIADGSAATKLGASFADSYPLVTAGLPAAVSEEIHLRTPAYLSWQEPHWLVHCKDACEFHGDASARDVSQASQQTKDEWMARYSQGDSAWMRITVGYQPGCDSALYKFVCRHCRMVLFGWDLS